MAPELPGGEIVRHGGANGLANPFAGHLTMDVHGMFAVVLAQAIWFIGVGVRLYREDSPELTGVA